MRMYENIEIAEMAETDILVGKKGEGRTLVGDRRNMVGFKQSDQLQQLCRQKQVTLGNHFNMMLKFFHHHYW